MDFLIKAITACAPVIVLLLVLDWLDTFNLIKLRTIAILLCIGGALAAAGLATNITVLDTFPIGFSTFSRYIAPAIEESLKAIPIVYLFATNRFGFKLDSALAGFAIGAGFSLAENAWYLHLLADANYGAWLVRGFGTAIMHGGATAFFAAVSHEMTEHQAEANAATYRFKPLLFLPGLVSAYAIHALFNHFPDRPMLAMLLAFLLLPIGLFFVLSRSDGATRAWIQADRDVHHRLLQSIRSGEFAATGAGKAFAAAAARFSDGTAADVRDYLELKLELVLRNEEMMLALQEGADAPSLHEELEKIDRLHAIEHRLGPGVLAAIAPTLGFSRNDLWELEHFKVRVRSQASS
jgi:RsiW-degrading membrane proteinase PrsW (M82 family)